MAEQKNEQFNASHVSCETRGNAAIIHEYHPGFQRLSFHDKDTGKHIGETNEGYIYMAQKDNDDLSRYATVKDAQRGRSDLMDWSQEWLEAIAA